MGTANKSAMGKRSNGQTGNGQMDKWDMIIMTREGLGTGARYLLADQTTHLDPGRMGFQKRESGVSLWNRTNKRKQGGNNNNTTQHINVNININTDINPTTINTWRLQGYPSASFSPLAGIGPGFFSLFSPSFFLFLFGLLGSWFITFVWDICRCISEYVGRSEYGLRGGGCGTRQPSVGFPGGADCPIIYLR
jgi:hypothetical protein